MKHLVSFLFFKKSTNNHNISFFVYVAKDDTNESQLNMDYQVYFYTHVAILAYACT